MAKPKEKKDIVPVSNTTKGDIGDLIGPSVSMALPDGTSLIIPTEKAGNRIANMIVAANVRNLIERSIKTYRDKDMLPTPKDLKDLAEAAKSLSQFSGDLYKEDEGIKDPEPKKVDKAPSATVASIDFDSALEKKKEDPVK